MTNFWARPNLLTVSLLMVACPGDPGTTEATTGTGTDATTGTTEGPPPTTSGPDTSTGPDVPTDATTTEDTTGPITVTMTEPDPTTTADATTGTTGDTTGASSTGDEPCPTEPCGDAMACCATGEMCLGGACVAVCGPLGPVNIELEWSWTTNEVTAVPLSADIQGDAGTELVVNANRIDGMTYGLGEIVALEGATGTELWRISDDPMNQKFGSTGNSTPVLADVSGDGRPDIIYFGRQDAQKLGLVVAVDGDGNLLWTSHTADDMPAKVRWDNGAAAAINLDDDPEAEIAVGGALFDDDGLMVWNQDNKSGLLGSPTDNQNPPKILYTGGLPTFADLTGDGKPELITGREAWTIDWAPGDPPTVSMTLLWQHMSGKANDGWPAVADIDLNGTPEVVLVAWPEIKVIDGLTGALWCGVDPTGAMCEADDTLRTKPIGIKGSGLGGPATIADFDGDGRPEAAIVGAAQIAVYDFNRVDEMVVKIQGEPAPAAGAMYARWSATIQDKGSAATGSTAFDFGGDGVVELAYLDECEVYIFDGATGTKRLEINNGSGTVHEHPLIADVDGDGATEFVVVANPPAAAATAECLTHLVDFVARKGVYVYRGSEAWAPTGSLWTQHSYHVTNAGPDGNVPLTEQANWTVPGLNNYRRAEQGACP